MKKFSKSSRFLSLVLVVVMVLSSLTGCKKSEATETDTAAPGVTEATTSEPTEAAAQMEDTTIKIRVMNDYGVIDPIIAEYEKRVKDDPIMSKIHLQFEFVGGADYTDKLAMAISAQEDYDLMFCGSWQGLDGFINSDSFKDITSYFNNNKFPGLKAAFSQDFLNPCYSYRKNDAGEFEKRLYTIPISETVADIRGLAYREDLRVKYNIPEITNDDIMFQYVQTIKENEPDMIPLQMANGFFDWYSKKNVAAQNNIYAIEPIGEEAPFYVAVSDDGKTVLDAVTLGDSADQFAAMPTGYQYDFIKESEVSRLKWADYLDPVRGTTETSVGTAAVQYSTVTEFLGKSRELKENAEVMASYPDASLRFYATEESQRNMVKGAMVSDMRSWNFLVVPAWSEKTDAVMYFLNWMWSNKENHDLFQFGIEGTNWQSTSDQSYTTLTPSEDLKYTMPGYSFTWNPTFVRYSDEINAIPEVKALYDYMLDSSSYTISKISGFTFNPTPVETQVASVTALSSQLLLRFALHGADTEKVIDQFNTDAKAAGLEDVRAEMIKQLQEFLDMKNAIK